MPENDDAASIRRLVTDLSREYTESITLADTEQVEDQDEIRYAVWDGQNSDGKKHDTDEVKVYPFDGSSDTRIRLADLIVNDNVDSMCAGFTQSQVNTDGIESRDAQVAQAASKALEWARNGGIPGLDDEVEFSAQWGQHYGWAVIQVVWSRRIACRYEEVSLQQVAAMAQKLGDTDGKFLAAISDPEQEDFAVENLVSVWPAFVKGYSQAIEIDEVPALAAGRASKIVRDLREKGKCKFPLPYVTENNPVVTALKPYSDVWFPVDTTDLQRARHIFRVDWMTAQELDAKVLSDNWDEDWVREAKKCAGRVSPGLDPWTNRRVTERPDVTLAGNNFKNLIEVVWGYSKVVDDDGVEQIVYTVFCPHLIPIMGPVHAIREPLDYAHGRYPFILYRRERTQRAIVTSRGIPEIVCTWQSEKKVQRDSLQDRTTMSVSPPLKVPLRNMGRSYRLGPAAQIGMTRGDEVEWMQPPPGNPAEAVELIREIGMDANEYFGRVSEGVDPVRANRKEQRMIDLFLRSWLQVFQQTLALMQQFFTDEDWMEITGSASPDRNFERIQRNANWRLHYDVRNQNTDFMLAKLKAFTEMVLPLDSAGVIDRAKLVMVISNWVDPSIARATMSDAQSADRKIFTQVQTDLALMALGNSTIPVEEDPTAGMKLNAAQQILQSNKKYQSMLQSDRDFAEKLDKWMKNMQFSVSQQQNKIIGRIGVNPNE
jgi:hypothetical protein